MAARIRALVEGSAVRTENTDAARALFRTGQFGALLDDGRIQLSPLEAVYLTAKKRLQLFNEKNKVVTLDTFIASVRKKDKQFWVRYAVFKDLRDRGYTVKTALKFGADFRVYDKGERMGDDHAKWIAYPVNEHDRLTWQEFASRNRVAHSTKKHLLVCVVDDEGDVSYWQVGWLKP
jgi:tRNA-intron endonuclease